MKKFTHETMFQIVQYLEENLENEKEISFLVINPDNFNNNYAGKSIKIDETKCIYRGYKSWTDLASKLFCKMLTPKIYDENFVIISFKKLNLEDSFHKEEQKSEKYGVESTFFNINKNEEPEVLLTYLKALESVSLEKRKRVLNLGVNKAEEFELIKEYSKHFKNMEFIGIDYCSSAIKKADEKFEDSDNVTFYTHDINKLDELNLGEFDLIISIGTLQSSNLKFNEVFMNIVQNYLNKDGAMILGFPNCRWIDGEIVYGAKAANYAYSEMSVLYKDAMFCKKYLQQKKFRVTLTGKYYIFLTATSIRKS